MKLMGDRPDPDALLKNIQAEENQRGRLKIFLGYVAGVGKTYAMLEAAHQRKAQGIDVVIGYIETHKRVETEELVEDLEVLPRKQVEYHSVTLSELDVDAVLARRPKIVLVDEFAHTNASGRATRVTAAGSFNLKAYRTPPPLADSCRSGDEQELV